MKNKEDIRCPECREDLIHGVVVGMHKQGCSVGEALEPHERRHAVLSRLGWGTKNLHHYTHPHLPGHVITSHPKSKEWTHHVTNPFTKQPERHGSGQWPGGHSFTGYLHDVHDRAHTSKAPEWRPMGDRKMDCPHCAKGVQHTDDQHNRWVKKVGFDHVSMTKKESFDENRFSVRPLGHHSNVKGYTGRAKAWGVHKWNNSSIDPSNAISPKIGWEHVQELGSFKSGKDAAKVAREHAQKHGGELDSYVHHLLRNEVTENRFLHHGHQQMHDLIQSLGYTREQPRYGRKEDFAPTASALTKSTYLHAHTGNKVMVLSHTAHKHITVINAPKDGSITKFRGTPESARKFLMATTL